MNMKNNTYHNPHRNIKVAAGSTGLDVMIISRTHEIIRGLAVNQRSQTMCYEAQNVEHISIVPSVDQHIEYATLMPNEIINAGLGDYESRLKLQKAGHLWMADKDFAADPGILDKDIGTGGNPRSGRALYAANNNKAADMIEKVLKNTQEYNRQVSASHNNIGTHDTAAAVNIYALFSPAGGTANGARFEFLHQIAEKAKELKINVKITPIELLLGTLDPGDRKKAALNQLMALAGYQVRLDGRYKEPHYTNGNYQQLCQPTIFMSNCNNHGQLQDLKTLKAVAAKLLDMLCYEPFGDIFSQEIINLHTRQKDDSGASRIGATAGVASINLNIDKIDNYLIFAQSRDFFDAILDTSNTADAQKQAQAAFTSVSLKETHTQDSAVQNLLSARNTSYKNTADKAKSIYRGQITTNFGFRACEERYYAAKNIMERQIPSQFIPAIQKQADAWIGQISSSFDSITAKFFQIIDGIPQAGCLWEEMLRLTVESEKINQEKLARAISNNKSLRTSVSQCEHIFHNLEKRHPIWRALSLCDKSCLKRKYPRYTEALIVNELELTARKRLAEVIYPAVKKLITAQLEKVNNAAKNALSTKQKLDAKAQRLMNLNDWLYCPNGIELADKSLMKSKLDQLYRQQEGRKNVMAKIFLMFCGQFNGLDALNTICPENITSRLYEHCKFNSQTILAGLNVLDAAMERFTSEQQQYELICQMTARSDGMVKVSGEHNENIPKKKYICGPDEKTVNWAAGIANDVGRQGGDWTAVVCPGISDICFVQYRAQISISQLIADTARLCNVPTEFKELAKLTDDPFAATTPFAGCDTAEIDRIIAEGILSGSIKSDNGEFIFVPALGEPVNTGGSIEAIRKFLEKDYYAICQIHNAFAHYMVLHHDSIAGQVKDLCQKNNHPLVSRMDSKAKERLLEVADALLPYAKRIPVNNGNTNSK